MRSVRLFLLFGALASVLLAQGYLSAVESNKKVVFDFYRLVVEPRNYDLAGQFVADGVIEHDPSHSGSSLQSFIERLKSLPGQAEDDIGSDLHHPPAFIGAEGDMVFWVFKQTTPDRLAFEAWRIKDRKIVEHWGGPLK